MHTKNNGFSLIEMSILLAVLAVFAVGILTQLTTQKEYQEITSVDNKMEKIREALDIYLSNNNYLPCPASGEDQMNLATFGTVTDCTVAATSGVTDIDDVDGATSDDDVRIGVLPVKELGLRADYMFDEWGNRFMYAVHKDLTNATSYAAYPATSAGGIAVQDGAGAALNSGLVPYLIMSNGKDGRGAYTKAGVYNACSTASQDEDKDNCDWSTASTPADAANALTFKIDVIRDDSTTSDFFYDKLAWGEQQIIIATPPTSTLFSSTLSSGSLYTCAIVKSTEKMWCWGDVAELNLQTGSPSPQPIPYIVEAGLNWTSVDSDSFSTCAITATGAAYCWGTGVYGKLGNGGTTNRTTPYPVSTSDDEGTALTGDWTHIDVDGSHSCGINDGKAYCWGNDAAGRLGNGTGSGNTGDKNSPSLVVNEDNSTFSDDWIHISAGFQFSCGIKGSGSSGRLYCWGENTHNNVAPSGGDRTYPFETGSAYTDWEFVTADDHTACAIRTGGKLYCWGNNEYYQSGTGSTNATVNVPTEVTALGDGWEKVTLNKMGQLAIHGTTVCGIHTSKIYCWGDETQFGKTGNGSKTTLALHSTPQPITTEAHSDYVDIDMSSFHVCAERSNGELYCWGRDYEHQFGNAVPYTASDSLRRAANSMLFN